MRETREKEKTGPFFRLSLKKAIHPLGPNNLNMIHPPKLETNINSKVIHLHTTTCGAAFLGPWCICLDLAEISQIKLPRNRNELFRIDCGGAQGVCCNNNNNDRTSVSTPVTVGREVITTNPDLSRESVLGKTCGRRQVGSAKCFQETPSSLCVVCVGVLEKPFMIPKLKMTL